MLIKLVMALHVCGYAVLFPQHAAGPCVLCKNQVNALQNIYSSESYVLQIAYWSRHQIKFSFPFFHLLLCFSLFDIVFSADVHVKSIDNIAGLIPFRILLPQVSNNLFEVPNIIYLFYNVLKFNLFSIKQLVDKLHLVIKSHAANQVINIGRRVINLPVIPVRFAFLFFCLDRFFLFWLCCFFCRKTLVFSLFWSNVFCIFILLRCFCLLFRLFLCAQFSTCRDLINFLLCRYWNFFFRYRNFLCC